MPVNATASTASAVKDLGLAGVGKPKIEYAFRSMCVLQSIRKHLIEAQLFAGSRVAACLPVTPAAASFLTTLRDGGATVVLCGARGSPIHDDVAASLVQDYSIPVFAVSEEDSAVRLDHIRKTLEYRPTFLFDYDGELTTTLLSGAQSEGVEDITGGIVETRHGAQQIRSLSREHRLPFPVFSMVHARVRHLFHSRYGTGQNTMDTIIRSLNVLIAGLNVVVVGFGAAGRGIAARAKGLGANIIITEVDPLRAVEAIMEGYRVMGMAEAASLGDIFIAASGNRTVVGREQFKQFRDGTVLCNAGHSDVEIDVAILTHIASSRRQIRTGVEEFVMQDGRRICLLAGGRPVQLGVGEGHPASILDLSFANQALSAEYLLQHRASLEKAVHAVPIEIDRQVAKLKLESMGVTIDRLTVEQEQYLATWLEGS